MPDDLPAAGRDRKGVAMVVLCLIVATTLKVLWAAHSIGSIDAILFHTFAADIEKYGLKTVYQEQPLFNHTPFTAALISAIYRGTDPGEESGAVAGVPAERAAQARAAAHLQDFGFVLRMLPILADVAL